MRRALVIALILIATAASVGARVPFGFPPLGFTPLPESVAASHARSVPAPAVLPDALDWRTRGVVTSMRDQGDCGGCWAFAGIALIESMCILDGGAPSGIDLSEQYAISCDTQARPEYGGFQNDGCCGGGPTIFEFFHENLLVAESRFPYGNGDFDGTGPRDCAAVPGWETVPCPEQAPEATNWQVESWSLIYPQPLPGVAQLEAALQNGPVWVGFYVYQDFFTYWMSGDPAVPYRHTSGPLLGGHAVELIGYDHPGGYWIAKNSWGRTGPFGDGTFRVAYDAGCQFGLNAAIISVLGSGTPVKQTSWGAIKAMYR